MTLKPSATELYTQNVARVLKLKMRPYSLELKCQGVALLHAGG